MYLQKKKETQQQDCTPCIEQRIRAGEVPLGEVLQETMLAIMDDPKIKALIDSIRYEPNVCQKMINGK